jgi:hypothetical protein
MHSPLKARSLPDQAGVAPADVDRVSDAQTGVLSSALVKSGGSLTGKIANTDILPSLESVSPLFSSKDLAHPKDQASGATAPSPIVAGRSLMNSVVSGAYRFVLRAVSKEWMAAPIAFAASMPATFITSWAVVAMAPGLERIFGGADTRGFALATSIAAIGIGYASYLILYWGGMVWKERRDLFDSAGRFSRAKLGEKVEIIKLDFLLHLPNDIVTIATMGAAQGGLYVSGASDLFWSIFLSQAAIDLFYCVKEPFYWRVAKEAAQWRRRGALKAGNGGSLDPANSDGEEVSADTKQAAN